MPGPLLALVVMLWLWLWLFGLALASENPKPGQGKSLALAWLWLGLAWGHGFWQENQFGFGFSLALLTPAASNSHNCTSGAHHERLMVDKSIITELPTADQDVQEAVGRQLKGMNKVFDEWFEKLAADEVAGHCFCVAVTQLGGLEL
ncbi:hypothetical protein B0H14DRAFT_2613674 [Mycena olivaceomarginata]|nr:hypothetical protein B0H14DRAFT_2613673 [Mycena olivaceomarginata]KAJ7803111.1 hypothetical protein B0H14DRAFT_2613674 [Mycena olivaceomarginata]